MRISLFLLALIVTIGVKAEGIYNVMDYGAVGDGLHASHLTFTYERPEFRPAVLLDDVKDSSLCDINAPTEQGVQKIVLKNCENIKITK